MRLPRGALMAAGVVPVAAIFALLVWAVAKPDRNPGGLAVNNTTGEAKIGRRQASDFTLRLFGGGEVTLQGLRGKVVMVDFWASWCPPCRREAAALESVWRQYQDRGVAFVGVDIWDREERAREFLQQFGITYPVGMDPRGALAVEYGVTGIPEKYFIDPRGQIARKFVGPMDSARLSRILDDMLAKERLAAS